MTTLPEGWTESAPGRLAINTDPERGGIIDCQILNPSSWFIVFMNDDIGLIKNLPSREAAFAAHAEAIAEWEASL